MKEAPDEQDETTMTTEPVETPSEQAVDTLQLVDPLDDSTFQDAPDPLDATFYYYQNMTTGAVSSNPMTLRQLCRLLCPVREGLAPILPPHTRCLVVGTTDWKAATEIPTLREAACTQWHYTTSQGVSQGPVSCKTLATLDPSTTMVYAQDSTSEWILMDKLPDLAVVVRALDVAPILAEATTAPEPMTTTPDKDLEAVQDELEAFLSSTAEGTKPAVDDDEDDDCGYESDGGTHYVKDPRTGNWIHEALAPPKEKKEEPKPTKITTSTSNNNSKPKKAKFTKKNAKHWIYVTGLPSDVTVDSVAKFFSKVGLLDLDPETLRPKVKLYLDDGQPKGDASICYARPESVELALQLLDESPWDTHHNVKVERATFQAKAGDTTTKRKRAPVSDAKRKVARLALLQAQDEGFGERLSGGRKGLRIIVVQHIDGIPENRLEDDLKSMAEEYGPVEKITYISKNHTVLFKFVEPTAASEALQAWHGKKVRPTSTRPMEAIYWDGVTDYTHSAEGEEKSRLDEEKRIEEFGEWIEKQELPAELRLQVEEAS